MPPLPSGLFFFKRCLIFSLYLLHFCFFIKIIITPQRTGHRSKSEGRGFLSLNLTFLGHGSGLCPKNLLSSKVISVSYEQFRVGFFLHLKIFFIFFKMNIFLIPSSFLFFLKNYYHFTKGMEPAQSPKPAVSNLIYSQRIYLLL